MPLFSFACRIYPKWHCKNPGLRAGKIVGKRRCEIKRGLRNERGNGFAEIHGARYVALGKKAKVLDFQGEFLLLTSFSVFFRNQRLPMHCHTITKLMFTHLVSFFGS